MKHLNAGLPRHKDIHAFYYDCKDINWRSDIRLEVKDWSGKEKTKLLAEASEIRKGTKNIGVQRVRTYQRGSRCEIGPSLIPA